MSDDGPSRPYLAALRILKHRWNSIAELRRKLKMKDFTSEEIDEAIKQVGAEGWLDDDRFAGAFVRTKARRKHGRLRIQRELRATGVSSDVVTKAIGENVDAEGERAGLVALCEKRMRIIARRHGPEYLTTDEGRKKLAGYLLQQGYETGVVLEVIRELTR